MTPENPGPSEWERSFKAIASRLPEDAHTPERRAAFVRDVQKWLATISDKAARDSYAEFMRDLLAEAEEPAKLARIMRRPTQDELNHMIHFDPFSVVPTEFRVWEFRTKKYLMVPFNG